MEYQLQTKADDEEMPPNITRGYTGLRNQGGTCYLNAVLQTLFMTEGFRAAVESSQDNSELSSVLKQLFKKLKSDGESVTTENITHVLQIGNVYEQQDAETWFLRILNLVSPDVSESFQGIMEYTTICRNPEHEHTSMVQTDRCFSVDISLESQSPVNVQHCFDSLFEPVSMCGEDRIYCTTCRNMRNMETNCKIKQFPSVLVLHLERFELDYNTMCYRKNTSRVEIPLQLSVKGERAERQYNLYAVVKHAGSLRSGHYFTDIRSFEDQKWYRFDDCSVHQIPDLKDQKLCDEAYLLLYKSEADAIEAGFLLSKSVTSEEGDRKTEDDQKTTEEEMSRETEDDQKTTEEEMSRETEDDQKTTEEKMSRETEDNQKTTEEEMSRETEDNQKTTEEKMSRETEDDQKTTEEKMSRETEDDQRTTEKKMSCETDDDQRTTEEKMSRETEDNQKTTEEKMSRESENPQTKTSREEKKPDHQPQHSEIHPLKITLKTLKPYQTPRKVKKIHQK